MAIPRAASSRPARILAAYAIAGSTGLLLTAALGHGIAVTVLAGFLTLLLMHLSGTLHPPVSYRTVR